MALFFLTENAVEVGAGRFLSLEHARPLRKPRNVCHSRLTCRYLARHTCTCPGASCISLAYVVPACHEVCDDCLSSTSSSVRSSRLNLASGRCCLDMAMAVCR